MGTRIELGPQIKFVEPVWKHWDDVYMPIVIFILLAYENWRGKNPKLIWMIVILCMIDGEGYNVNSK